jgi:hypothetical protein
MAKSPHTDGERGIVPDWWAIGITRRLQVHDRGEQDVMFAVVSTLTGYKRFNDTV